MMKGALENVEVLHFFFISVLLGGGILFSPIPPCLPLAYSHSSGVNDTEEWIQRASVLGGGCGGGNGPP